MRPRALRIAAALTALAFLPVVLGASSGSRAAPMVPLMRDTDGPLHGTTGFDAPVVDALLRGRASNLFASFGWDGATAQGSFVSFGFSPSSGQVQAFAARQGNDTLPILDSIEFFPSMGFGMPFANGPIFAAVSPTMILTVHDDPTGLLELRTTGSASTVLVRFPGSVTDITDRSISSGWPRTSVSFLVGGNAGRLILGMGTANVSGTTVIASMAPTDVLQIKSLSGFETERTPRAALVDAFGEGRIAAEYAMVAESDGGWIQNSARFRASVLMDGLYVTEGKARLSFRATDGWGGLVVLAFDPLTMPADSGHELTVAVDGVELTSAQDPVATFYGPVPSGGNPGYARLAMNATVLAVYIPDYRNATVEVSSVALPAQGLDWTVEAAAIAAVFVVSVAAGVMFHRKSE